MLSLRALVIVSSVFALSSLAKGKPGQFKSMGVIGDGISAGVAADPSYEFDGDSLWGKLLGETNAKENVQTEKSRAKVLPYSIREFDNPLGWVFKNFLSVSSNQFLSSSNHSWGVHLGESLNISKSNILIAAKSTEKATSAVYQVERILEYNGGAAPDLVLMNFSRGDVCGNFPTAITTPEEYGKSINLGLDHFFSNAKPQTLNGMVVLAGGINLIQNIREEEILSKKVSRYGEQRTCKELKEASYKIPAGYTPKHQQTLLYAEFLPPSPKLWCANLYDKRNSNKDTLSDIATTMKGYRLELKSIQKRFQRDLHSGKYPGFESWTVVYSKSSSDLIFGKDDISSDCFNLSSLGQKRLAEAVLGDLTIK